MEGLAMKKMFLSSKGNGNGVNTTNRCMGCTKDCESCIFKDVAGQFNKAAEEGGLVMAKDQKEVERQVGLCEEDMSISSSVDFPLSDVDKVLIHYFNEIFEIDEEHEKREGKKEERKKEPILCKPYLVTIKAIYHEYYGHMDHIIFRLATDAMGNVIKEPWSPHGTNPDGRLDSLVFGVALQHLTDIIDGNFELAEDALELCTEHEGEDGSDTTQEIIYQAGPNFMTKTIEIDPDGMVAIVRQIDSRFMKKEWVMAVFEMIKSNGENEYFIGLPTIDIPARKI
jgi:hypothetical protein